MVAVVGIADLWPVRRTRRDGPVQSSGPGLAAALAAGADIEEALGRLVVSSLELVSGADFAKISVIDRGRLRTVVASSQLAASLDSVQHVAGHGPCLDAISTRSPVCCNDLRTAARWPRFAPHVTTAGVRSVLCSPIDVSGDTRGTVSLFGFRLGAFDADSEAVGALLAEHAALAFFCEQRASQFRTALASRDVIGQAKGMIMERFGVDASRAFAMLRRISQETNTPVRDLAARLAGSPGQ
ncbi:GAF and ANTAR domain-containing protein [Mycobacterium sp. smrl_JER01]|uniref:GAF and ANTAR domain-containing protein n=1 Tax=Mycobacterium sp. smrl_JER01 TaxID=3402633 RepID=UPI003AC1608F